MVCLSIFALAVIASPPPSDLVLGTHGGDGCIVNAVVVDIAAPRPAVYDYIVLPDTPGEILKQRGMMPGIVKYDIISGPWDHPGALRQFTFTDGSTAHESIAVLQGPDYFAYKVSDFSGALGHIVDHIDGQWYFEVKDGVTRTTWSYSVVYKGAWARPLAYLASSMLIRPFMEDGMQRLKARLQAPGA